jgi:histidinol phosphatase-like enzyme
MIDAAAAKWGFDPRESFVVGDAPCDILLGQAVGAVTIRILSNRAEKTTDWPPDLVPDGFAADLISAAEIIERRLSREAAGSAASA